VALRTRLACESVGALRSEMEAGAIPVGAMAGVIDVHGVPGIAIGAKDGRHTTVIFAAFSLEGDYRQNMVKGRRRRPCVFPAASGTFTQSHGQFSLYANLARQSRLKYRR
jgi:hypothetical protein